jgi:O-antigen/teichoic acid export membrane protein
VGWYGAGRKWVDALNIIPQFFTMAVFPVMSHLAVEDRAGLQRSYRLSVKLLLLVALPVAILLTLLARPLVAFLSGPQFLPHGAVALRILIWSILLGWFNSLSNYVLIALDRQKFVLLASGARVAFALGANLLFLGAFSYPAAAGVIIGGEALLALLFYIDLRQQLGELEWGQSLGRPALAGGAMAVAVLLVSLVSRPLAFVLGPPVYVVALALLRVFTPEEWQLLAPLVPVRFRPFLEERKLLVRGSTTE